MLSQRVGPERYYDMLRKFGLGQRTGVGLPGESAGLVPPIDQWSGSTFANLPIGQGLSMTLLQMTGMYQAIANDGVRVPHALSRPPSHPTAAEPKNRAPTTFAWCRRRPPRPCARCCVPWCNAIRWATSRSTGPTAGVPGYQMAGKTGTAQQINPGCGCYFDDVYWITFAGIATADNPAT